MLAQLILVATLQVDILNGVMLFVFYHHAPLRAIATNKPHRRTLHLG